MIPNLFQVEPGKLWRGGRPESDADYKMLWERTGIVSVVNLEGDDVAAKEFQAIERTGRPANGDWLHRPISPSEIYFEGFPWALLENLQDWLDYLNPPIFVHCQHGQDRTGLVIAMYRVRSGWTGEKAYAEAIEHGYRAAINFGLDRAMNKIRGL